MKANISTLVNWWTRYSPLLARPAAPASVRKQCDRPTYFSGSCGLVEDLVGVHPAQGDLGGADQAEVGVLDRVDLRLGAPGREADAFQDRRCGPGRA